MIRITYFFTGWPNQSTRYSASCLLMHSSQSIWILWNLNGTCWGDATYTHIICMVPLLPYKCCHISQWRVTNRPLKRNPTRNCFTQPSWLEPKDKRRKGCSDKERKSENACDEEHGMFFWNKESCVLGRSRKSGCEGRWRGSHTYMARRFNVTRTFWTSNQGYVHNITNRYQLEKSLEIVIFHCALSLTLNYRFPLSALPITIKLSTLYPGFRAPVHSYPSLSVPQFTFTIPPHFPRENILS